ncbi:hypothetical protein BLAT2472_170042 [Burkholderia latens]
MSGPNGPPLSFMAADPRGRRFDRAKKKPQGAATPWGLASVQAIAGVNGSSCDASLTPIPPVAKAPPYCVCSIV